MESTAPTFPNASFDGVSIVAPSEESFKATKDFYTDIFGMKLVAEDSTRGAWIQLFEAEDPGREHPGSVAIWLSVKKSADDAHPETDGAAALQSKIKTGAPTLRFTVPELEESGTLLLLDPSSTLIAVSSVSSVPSKRGPLVAPVKTSAPFKALSAELLSPQLDTYLPMDHTPAPPTGSAIQTGKNIGILTSGGDCSGMNAAVRAVARVALQRGCTPVSSGLVQGGKMIKKLAWGDVKGFLSINRKLGSRKTLVIVAEGAIDKNLNPIKADYIKSVIETRLGLDTRATVQGVEAVEAVLRSTPDSPAPMIGMNQNKITADPLMDAVKLTHEVADAIAQKNFARAMELRDPDFTGAYNAYIESHLDGFSGLIRDDVQSITWSQVSGWQVRGGCELGTNRDHPDPASIGYTPGSKIKPKGVAAWIQCGMIAYHLQKHGIQALLLIGGFEAFTSMAVLAAARATYPAFCIPLVHLPATISNNVPGTDFSIGSDTALNAIVEACDRIKLSATASQSRVFVVEVHGGNCGYLSVLAGLAAGATNVYIPEEGITLAQLQEDVQMVARKFESARLAGSRSEGQLILRTESASSDAFSTDVLAGILRSEGRGAFDSRTAVLGHLQQGGVPSPLDRIRATRLAVNCIDWIETACRDSAPPPGAKNAASGGFPSTYTARREHACVIGIRGASVEFSPVEDLLDDADVPKRKGRSAWWMGLRRLVKVLAKYYFVGDEESS
ncbi:6-phosphofructokinase, alpha subunit, partial [Cladochytrium tenue]